MTSPSPASSSAELPAPMFEGAQEREVDNVASLLRQSAAATPDEVALREESGDTTYAELDERSNRAANALAAHGVGIGDRIAIVSANTHYFMELVFAAAKLGAIAAPINTRLSAVEIEKLLSTSDPKALFVGAEAADQAPPEGAVPSLAVQLTPQSYEELIAGADATDPGYEATADETAILLFSSGTTGLPKGIPLNGRNLSTSLYGSGDRLKVEGHQISMAPVPFFHVTGLTSALGTIGKGGTLLLKMPNGPKDLMRLLIEEKVTNAVGVPTLIQMLTQLPEAKDADWSHLQYFGYGGAPMPLPVIKAAREILGCELVQGYGLTETSAAVTVLMPEDHVPAPGREKQVGSVGRPLEGVEIKIVDPATREEVPVGERGEVWVRSSRVTPGYWNRPEENERSFTEDRWFATGDGGSVDEEGYLYLHDRIKDMIVTGAENVYPAEVESTLTGHPDVAEVAVIGIPSPKWGESPYAIIVPRPGTNPDADEIIAWSREQIAHYKCPVGVTFTDVLPRNPNGKLLKRVLRDQYADVQAPQ